MRNDWTFEPGSVLPNLPPPSSATFGDNEVAEWRLREYGSSGSELEPDAEPYPMSPTAVQDDDEDEMGLGLDRRRKRRRQMEEEMEWNEGLRTWMVRRDAWSGARSRRGVREMKEKGKEKVTDSLNTVSATAVAATPVAESEREEGSGSGSGGGVAAGPGGVSTSAALSDVSSKDAVEGRKGAEVEGEVIAARVETSLTIADKGVSGSPPQQNKPPPPQSTSQDKECDNSTADAEEKRKESTETAITEPDHHDPADENETAAESCSSSGESDHEEPLIPVVPSLIATTNPIRASITPAMYPSIYSKVVVQGLTPTVPINLADVTKAMVQGWKADGQWPSKPPTSNIVLQDDASVPKKGPSSPADGAATAGGSTETKRRRSSGMANAMRKVLHFSGHPFHRRGSSNEQRQDGHVAESGR